MLSLLATLALRPSARRRRVRLVVAVSMLSCLPFAAAHAAPGAAAYAGGWEMVIVDSGTSFRACSLKIEERDGGLAGELVWRWGSVEPFGGEKSARIGADGAFELERGDWKTPLVLRRVGDAIEGQVTEKDGKVFRVIGFPARDPIDVTGIWDVTVRVDGEAKRGLLRLSENGGALRARAASDEGQEVEVSAARRDGDRIRLTFATGDGGTAELDARAAGDRLTGTLALGDAELPLDGLRRRVWGPPVELLAGGLEGWHPRDDSRPFGWTLEGGVLTNSAGDGRTDVDIVSDASFGDFKLALEYKISERGNSGVYLRGRYEVQVLDDARSAPRVQRHGNGSVYSRLSPSKNASRAAGEWQRYEMTLVGRHLTVVLNGETLIDNQALAGITGGAVDPFEATPGPLMLQGDHGKVWYRNIRVTPSPGVELP